VPRVQGHEGVRFLLLGAGTVALGIGLVGVLEGTLARIGSIMVAFAGVGIIVASLARVDCRSRLPACAARIEAGDVSWHATTHELVSLLIFLALVAAPLVLSRAFSGGAPWRDLRAYSIARGVVGLVLLISGSPGSWTGVVQRLSRVWPREPAH
jgi:Protein of unknown function (DUF998)